MGDKNLFNKELLREEIKKRADIPDEEITNFLKLWLTQSFKRNELILVAGEVPKFSVFVVKGCLRQYLVNEKGEDQSCI